MLFNSFIFLGLLLITFVLYYLPFLKKNQITVFIVSSLIFYGYHQPELLLLLLLSAAINIVSSYYVVYGDVVHRKAWTTAGVSLNLLILLFFKYSPLISETFLPASDPVGAFLMTIPLPIGISFFTFQGISLMVDVYTEKYVRGSDVLPKSFLKHAERVLFFKSFFPQLISGPIIKAHDFLPQIRVKLLSAINWEFVFKNLITGYFLKMVVADNLKDFTFWIAFPYFQKFSSLTLLSMLFGFSIQIFSDFAGYSLIAIGLAALFGYEFRPNFGRSGISLYPDF